VGGVDLASSTSQKSSEAHHIGGHILSTPKLASQGCRIVDSCRQDLGYP
jgi:hypothetical protein